MFRCLVFFVISFSTFCWGEDFAISIPDFETGSNGRLELPDTKGVIDIYTVSPTMKVFSNEDIGLSNKPLIKKIKFFGARNETEQIQIVLRPNDDLRDVQLSFCSDIPHSNWTWYQVKEVYIAQKTYWYAVGGEETGYVPDPLVPGIPFKASGRTNTTLLLELQIGSNCPAGVFQSNISVVADGNSICKIPIELTVWPITLPKDRSLAVVAPNLTNDDSAAQQIKKFGVTHVKYGSQGLKCNYDNDNKKLSIDTSEYEKSMRLWIDQVGLKSIMLPPSLLGIMSELNNNYLGTGITVGSEEFWPVFDQFMIQMADFYRAHGWQNNVVWYMMDEIYEQHYPIVVSIAKRTRELFPELKILLVTNKVPDYLAESLDMWVVPWHFFVTQDNDYKIWDKLRDRNISLFAYMNSLYFMNAEWSLRSMRFFPSVMAKYGYDGCLWWGLTTYKFSGGQGNPWNQGIISVSRNKWDKQAAGAGYLIYPPTNENSEFCSSLRWENFKQGMDEYEMMRMLLEKYKEIEKCLALEKGTSDSLVRYWGSLLSDGFRLQTYRKDGQYIERFRKLLASEIVNVSKKPLVLADITFNKDMSVFTVQGKCQKGTKITINGRKPKQYSINDTNITRDSRDIMEFSLSLPADFIENVIAIEASDNNEDKKILWREGKMMMPKN